MYSCSIRIHEYCIVHDCSIRIISKARAGARRATARRLYSGLRIPHSGYIFGKQYFEVSIVAQEGTAVHVAYRIAGVPRMVPRTAVSFKKLLWIKFKLSKLKFCTLKLSNVFSKTNSLFFSFGL